MDDKPKEDNIPTTSPALDEEKLSVSDSSPSLATEEPAEGNTPPMPPNLEVDEPAASSGTSPVSSALPVEQESPLATEVTSEPGGNSEALPAAPIMGAGPQAPAAGSKNKALIVIVIALALVTALVYFFVLKKDVSAPATTSQTQTTASQAATADDVTQTSNDLDSALSEVDDTKDFASTDLADSSLGL